MTDITHVFDEPTAGLYPQDTERLNRLLLRLRDKGNTVLVVEHKRATIDIADYVVELGPGAGTNGGELVFISTVEELVEADTATARALALQTGLKDEVRTPTGAIEVRGTSVNNLRDVDVDIPTRCSPPLPAGPARTSPRCWPACRRSSPRTTASS